MSRIGTVVPADGLHVRSGPGTQHASLGILDKDERIKLIETVGEWWGAETRFGLGFVHGGFIAVEEVPDDTEAPAAETAYTCIAGDTLFSISRRFGRTVEEIAAVNGLVAPFVIQVGQVLRIPAAASGDTAPAPRPPAPTPVATVVSILNPLEFAGETEVTSSSLQGHHRPWQGASSCDLDIRGANSPGTPVRFNVAGPAGQGLRGEVDVVGLACRSQLVSDGGRTVRVRIQRQTNGVWTDTGTWVLYAHLDPVFVAAGAVIPAGHTIGALGPPGGGEYNSSCAQGSHVHVEALGARCVVNAGSVIRTDAIMALN